MRSVTFVRCIFHHIFTDGPDFFLFPSSDITDDDDICSSEQYGTLQNIFTDRPDFFFSSSTNLVIQQC